MYKKSDKIKHFFFSSWNDLDKFSMSNQTFYLLNNIELQIKNSEDGFTAQKDFSLIEDLLNRFWSEKGILEFPSEETFQDLSNHIEFFLSFLKMTRVVVDLGYSNRQMNENILYGIGHIFAPFMEERMNEDTSVSSAEKIAEKNGLNLNYWIMKFMKRIIAKLDNSTNFKEEIEAILHQTTKIFMIFTKIRINLQIIK